MVVTTNRGGTEVTGLHMLATNRHIFHLKMQLCAVDISGSVLHANGCDLMMILVLLLVSGLVGVVMRAGLSVALALVAGGRGGSSSPVEARNGQVRVVKRHRLKRFDLLHPNASLEDGEQVTHQLPKIRVAVTGEEKGQFLSVILELRIHQSDLHATSTHNLLADRQSSGFVP